MSNKMLCRRQKIKHCDGRDKYRENGRTLNNKSAGGSVEGRDQKHGGYNEFADSLPFRVTELLNFSIKSTTFKDRCFEKGNIYIKFIFS
jgi:hypothetical protein